MILLEIVHLICILMDGCVCFAEARVILACRDIVKCNEVRSQIIEETFNRNVDCVKLDLSSIKSIQDFAETINKSEPKK